MVVGVSRQVWSRLTLLRNRLEGPPDTLPTRRGLRVRPCERGAAVAEASFAAPLFSASGARDVFDQAANSANSQASAQWSLLLQRVRLQADFPHKQD